jgi:tetratricopeptide (TPR) repeat protein
MAEPFLSRFTPSLMSPEALEAVFVQREPLAQRLVDLIRESVASRSSQHTLLIGPRGIGKSHMVALVYHRLRNDAELRDHLLVAWLREEEWGVGSFLDLLIRILQALRFELGEAGLEELSSLYDLAPAEAERRAVELLSRYVGERTLLIIAENLDDIFAGLGSAEQRRLRAFLQEHNRISLLATSQSLFNGVSLQTSPFYGFFRIHHLDELEFQDAVRLLVQIAEFTGKPDLAASLQAPEGRARIRAVHHLAGGNPRVYVVFSQFLTRDSLEELVDPFMRLLDDLTPYYQSRMAWISPQQRKIVDFLCDRRGAVAVKEIARHCFISHQTTSSQLKALKELGYVSSVSAGRESYYELREPLMRLCMEVKRHRGEPIKLFVEFLRSWYSRGELEARLDFAPSGSVADRTYLLKALVSREGEVSDPRIRACLKDYNHLSRKLDFQAALDVAEEIMALEGWPVQSGIVDQPSKVGCDVLGLTLRAVALLEMGHIEGALADAEEAIRIKPSEWPAWLVVGVVRRLRGELNESLSAFQQTVDLGGRLGIVWIEGARLYWDLGRTEEALGMYDRALEVDLEDCEAWLGRGFVLVGLSRPKDALEAFDGVLRLDPDAPRAWIGRGLALGVLGCEEEAVESFRRAARVFRPGIREIDARWHQVIGDRFSETDDLWTPCMDLAMKTLMDFCLLSHDQTSLEGSVRKAMVSAMREADIIPQLSLGLVRSVLLFLTPEGRERASVWIEAWKKAAVAEPRLQIPVRLMESALKYLETRDERILLEVPIEERRLLEALLDGDEESETPLGSTSVAQ